MKKRKLLLFPFTAVLVLGLTACEHSNTEASPTQTVPAAEEVSSPKPENEESIELEALVTEGTETYRDFLLDNVLHTEEQGDIHFNLYVPEDYDGSSPYALFVTLPGYEGLYFQGVGANLRSEEYGFEAQKYNEKMIIAAPQLGDWGET